MERNPFYITDGYKIGHIHQYPKNTEFVTTNGTPRSNKHAPSGMAKTISIGQQKLMQLLHNMFEEGFFMRKKRDTIQSNPYLTKKVIADKLIALRESIVTDIEKRYSNYLGIPFKGDHIRDLWDLGYLPIEVKILPEGILVPMGVPIIYIKNTHKKFAWITNFLETPMSNMLWKMGTAASIAYLYKSVLLRAAVETDINNLDAVNFQAHNFSMRGMDGIESASNVALGHDSSFFGDDTLTSLVDIEEFYDYEAPAVFSVNATEHSVMCAGGAEPGDELATFRHLMKQFPIGILSIVSDTWDLWEVLTNYLVVLKDEIMARDGKIVIRPDSGNPVDIICGTGFNFDSKDSPATPFDPECKGVIELLWDVFGGTINSQGYKVLDPHIGAIYGDAITIDRARTIVEKLKIKGFASTNIVLGIGSYTYQMNTRDTYGFAMKATHVVIDGVPKDIFKDPVTDDGRKKSARGRLCVINNSGLCNNDQLLYDNSDKLELIDKCSEEQEDEGLLTVMYKDGKFIKRTNFGTIRERIRSQIDGELGLTLKI